MSGVALRVAPAVAARTRGGMAERKLSGVALRVAPAVVARTRRGTAERKLSGVALGVAPAVASRRGCAAKRAVSGVVLRLAPTVLFALLLAIACNARAQVERPALHWTRGTGAESCIDPRSLARAVEDITGPALVAAARADVSIEARIEASEPGTYSVHMHLSSPFAAAGGERVVQFKTTECRSLDSSIALLIATAIDPTLGADGLPHELNWVDEGELSAAESLRRDLSTGSSPHAAASPERAASPAPAPRSVPSEHTDLGPTRWQLGLAALGGSGADNRFAAGLVLELGHAFTPRFALAAQLSGETGLTPGELVPGRSAIAQRFVGALLACLRLPLSAAFELRGCAGPELGMLLAHGSGFATNKSTALGAAGAVARADVLFHLSERWSIALSVLLHAELLRPTIRYEIGAESFQAFRAAPLQLQAAIGVRYDF